MTINYIQKGKTMKQTITLTNMQVREILSKLTDPESIVNTKDTSKRLPVPILWKINGNIKVLKAIQDRIQEEDEKINSDYFNEEKSDKTENGQLEIKPEFRTEFITKKEELYGIENALDLDVIKLDELSSFEFVPSDFMAIEFMITDEEQDPQ